MPTMMATPTTVMPTPIASGASAGRPRSRPPTCWQRSSAASWPVRSPCWRTQGTCWRMRPPLPWPARRSSDWQRTYGFHRFQVIAAYTNGITLIFIAAAVIWEAFHRFQEPVPVLGGPMLVIASIGLLVNVAAYLALHGADRDNLNVRGAM